jgi:formamidopyrimidine-DNA glycosylase
MPELPEILRIGRQMKEVLRGATISAAAIYQPKCLNVPVEEFLCVQGRRIVDVEPRGKWIMVSLEGDLTLLLNLGMGGELRYHPPSQPPAEGSACQARFDLADGACFTVRFFWFGYVHLVSGAALANHQAGQLGPSPLDDAFTADDLRKLVRCTRRSIKSLIQDQRVLAGIGNAYIHDILFLARIHPTTPANTLTDAQVNRLHTAMREGLQRVIDRGGLKWETDLFGNNGEYDAFLVGYRKDQPCPACGAAIQVIKTGSTRTYICPSCQPFPDGK